MFDVGGLCQENNIGPPDQCTDQQEQHDKFVDPVFPPEVLAFLIETGPSGFQNFFKWFILHFFILLHLIHPPNLLNAFAVRVAVETQPKLFT